MAADGERRVTLHHGPAGLRRIEAAWRTLEEAMPGAPFHSGYQWHRAWLEALEPRADEVMFAVFEAGDHCRGILPLLAETASAPRWQPRVLEVPRRTGMDLSAVTMAPGQRLADWWPALRRALKAASTGSFIIRLTGVPLEPASLAPLAGMETRMITRVQNHRCWFDCRRSHEAITAGYTTRLKKILRRGHRKLAALGPLTLRRHHGREAIDAAYPEFLRLEASGWKAEGGTALAQDTRSRRFHETFLFADDGARLQINLLLAGETAVAAQLCARQGGTLSLMKIAHDQALAKASPGSVLLDLLLQHGCDTATCETIDLITGQPWMENWGAARTEVADLWLFDRPATAAVARGATRLRDRLRRIRERSE